MENSDHATCLMSSEINHLIESLTDCREHISNKIKSEPDETIRHRYNVAFDKLSERIDKLETRIVRRQCNAIQEE